MRSKITPAPPARAASTAPRDPWYHRPDLIGDSGDQTGRGRRHARRRRGAGRLAVLALVALAAAPAAASATTYYVSPGGNDSAAGTSPTSAWRSLSRIGSAGLQPGDSALLQRGGTWTGQRLNLGASGTASAPVTIGAYGTGALPIVTSGGCFTLSGNYQVVAGLEISNCTRWGVWLTGTHGTVSGSFIHDNISGVEVDGGSSQNTITGNQLINNNRLANPPSSGAFGVLLNGNNNLVEGNVIRGSDTASPYYGTDGSAVEVYGGQNNLITRNLASNNDAFTELGSGSTTAANNTYSDNIVTGSIDSTRFIVTRGGGTDGPVNNTRAFNNTVYFTGANAQGFTCDNCRPGTLYLRNNIISAPQKVGYADQAIDEDDDLFLGGGIHQWPNLGAHSLLGQDPKWVNPAAGDFHLQAGSPAIHAGQDMGAQTDFDGKAIAAGATPDLGALQWSTNPPPAPVAPPPAPPLQRSHAVARPLLAGIDLPRSITVSALMTEGARVACSTNTPGRCRVFLGLRPADARHDGLRGRLRHGIVVIGGASITTTGRQAQGARIRLSPLAIRRLRHLPHAHMMLHVQTEVTASNGHFRLLRRTLMVRPTA